MWIHGIRDKTFPFSVPQLKKNYKNGTLTKNKSRDEELAFAQTTSSLLLKSALRFLLFLQPLHSQSALRFLLFLQPLHSHRSGFIPYFVKVSSDRKFFCDSVLKFPESIRLTRQKSIGKGDRIRTAERLCLLVCIISAGSGRVKAAQHPKGKALTRPDLCRL